MNRHFTEDDAQMAQKHRKTFLSHQTSRKCKQLTVGRQERTADGRNTQHCLLLVHKLFQPLWTTTRRDLRKPSMRMLCGPGSPLLRVPNSGEAQVARAPTNSRMDKQAAVESNHGTYGS